MRTPSVRNTALPPSLMFVSMLAPVAQISETFSSRLALATMRMCGLSWRQARVRKTLTPSSLSLKCRTSLGSLFGEDVLQRELEIRVVVEGGFLEFDQDVNLTTRGAVTSRIARERSAPLHRLCVIQRLVPDIE